MPDPEWRDDEPVEDGRIVKLARLKPGEQFVYVFDLGDDWAHLCTVGNSPLDPLETLGSVPDRPLPYFGWGAIRISTVGHGAQTMVRLRFHLTLS